MGQTASGAELVTLAYVMLFEGMSTYRSSHRKVCSKNLLVDSVENIDQFSQKADITD
jgi:hypothetical protein